MLVLFSEQHKPRKGIYPMWVLQTIPILLCRPRFMVKSVFFLDSVRFLHLKIYLMFIDLNHRATGKKKKKKPLYLKI